MNSHFFRLLGVATAATAVSSFTSQAQIISDSFSTNTLANYTGSSGRTKFSYDATNERASMPSNNVTYGMAANTSIGTFAGFGTFTLSIDFLTNSALNTGTGAANWAAVGVATSNSSFYQSTAWTGMEVTVRGGDNSADRTEAFLRFRMNDDSGSQILSGAASFASSTWHRLTLTLESTATPNLYNFSASVATQADPSTSILTLSQAGVTNLSIGGATDLFAGFAGNRNTNRGSIAMDNFVVVPEPSTMLLAAGGLTILVTLRRRRRA